MIEYQAELSEWQKIVQGQSRPVDAGEILTKARKASDPLSSDATNDQREWRKVREAGRGPWSKLLGPLS